MKTVTPLLLIGLSLAFASVCGGNAVAGDVRIGVSAKETYVGYPVMLQIEFNNVAKHESPELPKVDGLKIEPTGAPAQKTQIFNINGRQSKIESFTYSYAITPEHAGGFVIPPLTVSYDGRKQLTESVRFSATKSEVGDLAFVEITGDRPSVYVGEPIKLTLKIWIKPYQNEDYRVTLSEEDMWGLISPQTDWGLFTDRMNELAENRQRPGGERVQREADDGTTSTYYLYEIDAEIYPQHSGSIDGSNCRIVIKYPTELKRTRSPLDDFFGSGSPMLGSSIFDDAFSSFGPRLTISSIRPVIVDTKVSPIEIKPIPSQGRPANYRGAVGDYEIYTQATPTAANAGDPITLNIAVRGDGPMDRIQPPLLNEQDSLTKNFKVADESLAGFVDGNQKLFTTTIRPVSETVTEIPAIEFSFFDPRKEKFVTVQSKPIPVEVSASETLSFEKIVANADTPNNDAASAVEDSVASVPSVYAVDDLLESKTAHTTWSPLVLTAIALPPLAFAFSLLFARRGVVAAGVRSLLPLKHFEKACAAATTPRALSLAMREFLASYWKLNQSSEMVVVGQLRQSGNRELAVRLESWFDRCRQAEHGVLFSELDADNPRSLQSLKSEARQIAESCVDRKATRAAKTMQAATGRSNTVLRSLIGIALLGCSWTQSTFAQEAPSDGTLSMTGQQQHAVLSEAEGLYHRAAEAITSDPEQAKAKFAAAAAKYQAVVDSGVQNAKLYYNLGNSYRMSGSNGRAVAYFRQAIVLDPNNPAFAAALRQTLHEIGSANETSETAPDVRSITRQSVTFLFSKLPRHWILWSAIAVWAVAWLMLVQRGFPRLWFGEHRIGRAWPVGLILCSIVLAGVVAAHDWTLRNPQAATVVATKASMHSRDDATSPEIGKSLHEASEVIVSKRRGDWVKVTSMDQRSGWLRSDEVR
ncbi:BatD family protein [Novipirellula sp. SH528]|uniref:BatD family protein n=1 Tax=Novipirellula sp. SH528 TaxID=3454466 RepID=UPI003F9F5C74